MTLRGACLAKILFEDPLMRVTCQRGFAIMVARNQPVRLIVPPSAEAFLRGSEFCHRHRANGELRYSLEVACTSFVSFRGRGRGGQRPPGRASTLHLRCLQGQACSFRSAQIHSLVFCVVHFIQNLRWLVKPQFDRNWILFFGIMVGDDKQ